MMQHGFYVNGQVVSFFSELIMIIFILVSIRERKQAGVGLPKWVFHIYGFLALDALLAGTLAGFQLNNTDLFFAARRALVSFAILFIFLTIFDFPEGQHASHFARERRLMIIFVVMQVVLNILWFFLALYAPAAKELSFLKFLSHVFLALVFLWMAFLVRRKGKFLQNRGEEDTALLMKRFRWMFWLSVLIAMLPFLSLWLPAVGQVQATASSYGWVIVCAGSALIFLGFRRNQRLSLPQLNLVILLALLLALGLVAEVVAFNLGKLVSKAELSHIMSQFILAQIGIVLVSSLTLPRWLGHLLPEEISLKTKPLTSRQREIMR